MEKEALNDGARPHTPGTDDKLGIGSPLNTGGRHGAEHKINTGNAGTNSQNGDLVQQENPASQKEPNPSIRNKNADEAEQSFNGNNDADANRTPYAGVNKE